MYEERSRMDFSVVKRKNGTRGLYHTFIRTRNLPEIMKKQFILGLAGGFLGISTAIFIILSATTSDYTLSGVQAALFSTLGIMGAAISRTETRFAGWMLLSSAVWITLSVPIAGTLSLLYFYTPAIILLLAAAILSFAEPEVLVEDPGLE